MHSKRLVTAAIVLPLAVAYVMWLPAIFFVLLICLAGALALVEFFDMYGLKGPMRYAGVALALMIPVGTHIMGSPLDHLALAVMVIAAVRMLKGPSPEGALKDAAPAVVGLAYIPALLAFQSGVRGFGPEWIIFLYAVIWGSDSAAYYLGKNLGKKKLYTAVSPNKTVEGAVASIVGGALCSVILKLLLVDGINMGQAIFIGAVIGTVTIIGDLVESMFKRDAGVKDSSAIIPGHGGVLDKIDGVLFSGPVLYWMLKALAVTN